MGTEVTALAILFVVISVIMKLFTLLINSWIEKSKACSQCSNQIQELQDICASNRKDLLEIKQLLSKNVQEVTHD